MTATDPYASLKAAQREGWALFAPIAPFTTPAAARLVAKKGFAATSLDHIATEAGMTRGAIYSNFRSLS